jgi:glycosyltransferase involved in cell wall biosynthesis
VKPRIVLSGVNFNEGGPLSVFRDALQELARHHAAEYEIVALVHRRSLFDIAGINYMEFPTIKSSWLQRLRFEYWSCRALSRQLQPHLWLSMHDITPNVTARVRAVYCHNPSPFYHLRVREAALDWKFSLFTLFYRFLYRINIRKNQFVIVQQQWLRHEFQHLYGVQHIVVAHPSIPPIPASQKYVPQSSSEPVCRFFYPAYSRTFKNFEVILEATQLLEQKGVQGFEIWLTVAGDENRYAAGLLSQFGNLRSIRWMGIQPRERVMDLFASADCLLFPSRLETWGMPISEFQQTGKPMLVADLPYAHETVGTYRDVSFFDPADPTALAECIERFLQGTLRFDHAVAAPIAAPFAPNWAELFHILLRN